VLGRAGTFGPRLVLTLPGAGKCVFGALALRVADLVAGKRAAFELLKRAACLGPALVG
jgi:hypothetical protein